MSAKLAEKCLRESASAVAAEAGPASRNVETLGDKQQVNPETALVMVVRCNDPQQLQKEVTSYFATNNITWSTAPQQVPVTLNDALAKNSTGVQADESPSQWQALLSNRSTTQPTPQAQTPDKLEQMRDAGRERRALGARGPSFPATQPSNPDAAAGMRQQGRAQYSFRDQQNQQGQQGQQGQQSGAMLLPVDTVYVARRVTQRQVQELNLALTGRADVTRSQVALRNTLEQSVPREASENEQVKKAANEANTPTPALQPSAQSAATASRSAPAPSQTVAPSPDQKMAAGRERFCPNPQARPLRRPIPSDNNLSNFVAGVRYFRSRESRPQRSRLHWRGVRNR